MWSPGVIRLNLLMFSVHAFINEMYSEVELMPNVAKLMRAAISLLWVAEHHYCLHQKMQ